MIPSALAVVASWLLLPAFYDRLFPGWIEDTKRCSEAHPWQSTLLGFGVVGSTLFISVLLLPGSGILPYGAWALIIFLGAWATFGFASMAHAFGSQIDPSQRRPWRALLGGVMLTIGCSMPLIGWFGLLPYLLLRGMGASLRARMGRGETGERAGRPSVEGSRPSPALILFFLSPAIGELLSGSAPPLEFFQPIAFLLLSALYGSGAVLVRELAHRWGKGWPTVLALGAAYGILEEGLMVKSFFDPHWVDLGILGEYGRWAGVNWVWSLNLTLYHAVFSISIPILLVGLIFPGRHGQAWVSQRTFRRLWVLLALVVAFGYFVLTPYRPPLLPYAMAALSACALFLAGRRLPERFLATDPSDVSPTSPFWFGAIAFLITAGAFVLGGLLPSIGLPPWVTMATQIALTLSASLVITKILSKGGSLTPTQQLALASGALGFFVLLSPLQELDPTRTDNPVGMSLVGLGASIFLAWLILRLRRRMSEEPRIAFHGR